jgi:hypothetical protein
MGRVENGQPVDHLRMIHRRRPGDRSTPIMTDQHCGLSTQLTDQSANVSGQQIDGIGLETVRLR